jgi:thymidylate synthase
MHIELESLRTGYADLGRMILDNGEEVSPRGEKTMEVLGASFTLRDPRDSLPVGTGRGVVKALAATETLQLIGGFHDPVTLVKAAPHFAGYLGVDGKQRAPYGPRLAYQIPVAIERLTQDPDSRQAQVVVWQPDLDNHHGLHDYPCTTSLQWFIRGDYLHMQVHMRSNDFWLGVPYDVFQFTQLQLALASILRVEPGPYRHSAASLHIYEKHWEKARDLHAPDTDPAPTYGIRATSWHMAQDIAYDVHYDLANSEELTPGERWLHLAMAPVHG